MKDSLAYGVVLYCGWNDLPVSRCLLDFKDSFGMIYSSEFVSNLTRVDDIASLLLNSTRRRLETS